MSAPRVFGVSYQFLSCGDVFTQGLVHAADDLGVEYAHADWSAGSLPQKLQAFKPDLVLVVHGRKFVRKWPKLLDGYRSAIWLLDEPYEVDDTSSFSSRFDQVFVNDPSTVDRHQHASYLPVCYDPHRHVSSDEPRDLSVGFIGGGNATRDRYLAKLAHDGLLTYVVGGSWGDAKVNKLCKSRNISPDQTVAFYQRTQIIVNVFREKHHFNRQHVPAWSLNPRVYEALACGALVVSEWRPEVDAVVPELPTFKDEAGLVSLIHDLQESPEAIESLRTTCAASLVDETYTARLQTVLDVALGCRQPAEVGAA